MPWPPRSPTRPRRRAPPWSRARRSATRAERRRSSKPSGPERRTTIMRITITGASGLIGSKLVTPLRERGDEVTTVSLRNGPPDPADLVARDAIVHLAGENVAQRWSDDARRRIRESRELGTRQLINAIAQADPKPRALISSSAVGYYGPHGDELLDEQTPPGHDF